MKVILGFILIVCLVIMLSFSMTYGQDKKEPSKQDTIKIELKDWQKQHITELQAPIQKLVQEYIEAIISTIADPKKVRYGMDDKGRIIIIQQ
jgi:hypothetical protein